MKNRLKYLASFFIDIPVERVRSGDKVLNVDLYKGEYVLSGERALYSHGDRYRPFAAAFRQTHIGSRKIGSALVLGLGLGSIPQLLRKHGVSCPVTCVESEADVIVLCKKYLSRDILDAIIIVNEDAHKYVNACVNQFDLVIHDVFVDDQIPAPFQEPGFLQKLGSLVAPGGLLMYNRLMIDPVHVSESLYFLENIFRKNFPASSIVKVPGNLVLIHERPLA